MNRDKKPLWKKIVVIVLLGLGIASLIQSSFSLYRLWRRRDRVDERQLRLNTLEKEQELLKKQLSDAHTPFFIEKEARDKLGMIKPGETVVYLAEDATESGVWEVEEQSQQSVLKQWRALFF